MTKRQLGFLLIGVGILACSAILAVEILGIGQFRGIGPTQRIALGLGGLSALLGVTLLPLGDRPA